MVRSRSSAQNKKKSVLNKTIDFFVHSPYHAYLVGGYVRDTTLGIQPVDIDIVVEGDAIKVAHALRAVVKGTLYSHKEFGTASVITREKRIDLASARVEMYPLPAKLPHVHPSTIIEDLNRRDFTINAIAMSISNENFGEIFDPFKGMDDIKGGLIRILHKNSFIDDPTRIFRALRYKNRFGFKIEETTKLLMKEAIAQNMVQQLTGQRILNELRLVFAEETYLKTVKDMSDFRIFKIDKKTIELLPPAGDSRLYVYLSRIDSQRLPVNTEERKIVNDCRNLRAIIERLSRAKKNSDIYSVLSPVHPTVIATIMAIRPDLGTTVKQFSRLKRIQPFVTGYDLKRLGVRPVTAYKEILARMFRLQLNNQTKHRKDALRYLRKAKR